METGLPLWVAQGHLLKPSPTKPLKGTITASAERPSPDAVCYLFYLSMNKWQSYSSTLENRARAEGSSDNEWHLQRSRHLDYVCSSHINQFVLNMEILNFFFSQNNTHSAIIYRTHHWNNSSLKPEECDASAPLDLGSKGDRYSYLVVSYQTLWARQLEKPVHYVTRTLSVHGRVFPAAGSLCWEGECWPGFFL